MTHPKDIVLNRLVQKKKSLLDDLLVLSIRSACDITQNDSMLNHRSNLLNMLKRNDEAIAIREKQTGIVATGQEQDLYADIAILLSSIEVNNHATLINLEELGKEIEAEKSKLGIGKKLSSYVVQTKTVNRYRQKTHLSQAKTKLVKGTA